MATIHSTSDGSEMVRHDPVAELDSRFSSDDATATPWAEGSELLAKAEVY